MPYSTREVEQLLGLRGSQVRAFVREGFLSPDRGPRGELRFSFQDLVLLRTAGGLLSANVPAARVRSALRRLRDSLPDGAALEGLDLRAEGRDVLVRQGGAPWITDSGQALFDFDVATLARDVASLEAHRALAAEAADPLPAPAAPEKPSEPTRAAPLAADARSRGAADADRAAPAAGDPEPDPRDATGWYRRACAIEDQDSDAARAAYRRALDADPGHVDALVNLGRLLHDAGDALLAERHYRVGIALRPDDLTATFNLAVALEDLARVDEAIATYHRALAIDPACADAHYNLARLYERAGQRLAAVRHRRSYRELSGE